MKKSTNIFIILAMILSICFGSLGSVYAEDVNIDITVPEKVSFIANDNRNFSNEVTVKNNSGTIAVNAILSASQYGDWKLVPSTTDFDTMGANQKKFSLLAKETNANVIDLALNTFTFNASQQETVTFELKGETGPVTEDINDEKCVTVSLYITPVNTGEQTTV